MNTRLLNLLNTVLTDSIRVLENDEDYETCALLLDKQQDVQIDILLNDI